jgi:hypothetical protein
MEYFIRGDGLNYAFALGVLNSGVVNYMGSRTRINSGFYDSGYVKMVPVAAALTTLDTDAATDFLNFHWRVSHSEFDSLPNVSHTFSFLNEYLTGSTGNMVSGRVLFDAPYTRQVDSLSGPATGHVINSGSLYYNGADISSSNFGVGTPLTNAAYTAGNIEMFQGRPEVFFSRNNALNADFNTGSNWNELGQFSSGDDIFDYHGTGVSGNTEYPQDGDIAFIGFDPVSGRPHSYEASTAGVTAAEVRFTPLQNPAGDRLPRFTDLRLQILLF